MYIIIIKIMAWNLKKLINSTLTFDGPNESFI